MHMYGTALVDAVCHKICHKLLSMRAHVHKRDRHTARNTFRPRMGCSRKHACCLASFCTGMMIGVCHTVDKTVTVSSSSKILISSWIDKVLGMCNMIRSQCLKGRATSPAAHATKLS
jgi:hypothetical protein